MKICRLNLRVRRCRHIVLISIAVGILPICFVMSDNASGNSAELAMARDVTGNSADDSPLDAALCLSSYRQSNKSDERGGNDESFHYQIHVSTKLRAR